MKMIPIEEQQLIELFDKNNRKKSNNIGNILFIYENPVVIKAKYNGTTIMILLTETFSESKEINEEEDKFKVYYFKSN